MGRNEKVFVLKVLSFERDCLSFKCDLLQDRWRAEKKSSPTDLISTYKNQVC